MQWMVVSWTPAHPPLKKTDINLHMQIKLTQGVYTLKSGWLFGKENGWRTVHESPPAMACTPLSGPGRGLGHLMAITAPTSSTTFCHCISYPLTYTYIYICTDIHIHTYFFMCVCVFSFIPWGYYYYHHYYSKCSHMNSGVVSIFDINVSFIQF